MHTKSRAKFSLILFTKYWCVGLQRNQMVWSKYELHCWICVFSIWTLLLDLRHWICVFKASLLLHFSSCYSTMDPNLDRVLARCGSCWIFFMVFRLEPVGALCILNQIEYSHGFRLFIFVQCCRLQTAIETIWNKRFQPQITVDTRFVSPVDHAK